MTFLGRRQVQNRMIQKDQLEGALSRKKKNARVFVIEIWQPAMCGRKHHSNSAWLFSFAPSAAARLLPSRHFRRIETSPNADSSIIQFGGDFSSFGSWIPKFTRFFRVLPGFY